MNIKGLQKLTLLDYPGSVACTVFTGGCNFRCPFCHNASLVTHIGDGDLTEEEFFAFLEKRQGILDGVCITGGEPLLNNDISAFMNKIHQLGFSVKLDTNGSFPERLRELIELGQLDYIAMDIKNSQEKYGATVGRLDFDISPILKSVELIMKSGIEYEFRTTVVNGLHEPKDFENIGKWLTGAEKYFIQAFVDSGDLIGKKLSACEKSEMDNMLETVKKYIPNAVLRGV